MILAFETMNDLKSSVEILGWAMSLLAEKRSGIPAKKRNMTDAYKLSEK
jgi:hypothetical protein